LIKFFNGEPIDVPLVEHASMTLAAQADIRVAETRVVRLRGENALLVRRYDRVGRQRIHCVSAGTALRAVASADEPDLGYPDLALLLRRAGVDDADRRLADMHELFRRMVFNILIDNTDDHEKNHALMVVAPGQHGRFLLAAMPTWGGLGRERGPSPARLGGLEGGFAQASGAQFRLMPSAVAGALRSNRVSVPSPRCRSRRRSTGMAEKILD
jgi:serine/threonine-protein kinase HipA